MTRILLLALLLSCFVAPYLVTPRDTEKGRVALSPRSDRLAIDAGAPSGRLVPVERRSVPPPATYVRIAPIVAPAVTRQGWATWYDDGPGLYGAVPSWRWGDEPYTVQVCGFEGGRTNCVLVAIRDFCACGPRHGVPTVIDLSPAAFRSLAPLSRGVILVQVDGVARAVPTAPATDATP